MIEIITEHQLRQISIFRNKWNEFILSTKRISQDKVINLIVKLYYLINEDNPEILVCKSPQSALLSLPENKVHLGKKISKKVKKTLMLELEQQVSKEFIERLFWLDLRPSNIVVQGQVEGCVKEKLNFMKFISTNYWFDLAILSDYCINAMNASCDIDKTFVMQEMFKECGCILPYSGICIVCDRPTKIISKSFDDGNCLHSEEEPAVQFSDGFSLNVHYGELVD